MAGIQQYECPCCGGSISFNSTIQKMKCPYCDTEFDVEAIQSLDEELLNEPEEQMEWQETSESEWQEEDLDGLRMYQCDACGAQIVADETLAATTCPYCDNNIIMMNQFQGHLKPDYIIPFKVDKEAAKNALRNHCKGKRLLPKVFKDENHIDEIKGLYVPVWLFDADADANMRYRATRVRSWSDSRYIYTETSTYSVLRAGTISFEQVPVDGASKMPDELMESIEPYNFSEAVDFRTAYLAGYLADKYDVTAAESVGRANERIKRSTERSFASTVQGYSSVIPESSSSVRFMNGRSQYALYPVWILNTSWKGEKYTFAMNGQTGKFVGDLPVDKKAFARWFGGIFIIVAIVLFIIQLLVWML